MCLHRLILQEVCLDFQNELPVLFTLLMNKKGMIIASNAVWRSVVLSVLCSFGSRILQANTIVADDIDHGPGRNLTLVTSSLHTEDSTDWVRRRATPSSTHWTTTRTRRRSIPSHAKPEQPPLRVAVVILSSNLLALHRNFSSLFILSRLESGIWQGEISKFHSLGIIRF